MCPGELTLRITPGSGVLSTLPACFNSRSGYRAKRGHRKRLLRVKGGGSAKEGFMEEGAALKEEEMGEHRCPRQSRGALSTRLQRSNLDQNYWSLFSV